MDDYPVGSLHERGGNNEQRDREKGMQIGHVGYSPDFKSRPRPHIPSVSIAESPKDVEIERLRAELDRISELVWENADRIDFTGYEDIRAALEEARGGEEA
jgi:hypothetical protein